MILGPSTSKPSPTTTCSAGAGIKGIDANVLFGSKITVTEVDYAADGSSTTIVSPYYLYRFIDGTDADPDDQTVSFEKTAVADGVKRDKPLLLDVGGPRPNPT